MNRFAVIGAVLLLASAAFSAPPKTDTSKRTPPAIEELMTAAEFRASGLQKLTPEELAALNTWLGSYSYALALRIVQPRASAAAETSGEVIESHIDGDFEGWEGETIFKLDNGQIWQQASYAYTYHYAYHPKVLIYRSGGGYKMKVDGVDDALPVKRLK
jgi:hypothetical protein